MTIVFYTETAWLIRPTRSRSRFLPTPLQLQFVDSPRLPQSPAHPGSIVLTRLIRVRRKPASSDLSAELALPTSQFRDLFQPRLTLRHSCTELHSHSAVADLDQQRATASHCCPTTSTTQFTGRKRPDYFVYSPQHRAQRVLSNNVDESSHLPQPNDLLILFAQSSIHHSVKVSKMSWEIHCHAHR